MTRFEDPIRGFSRSVLIWGDEAGEVSGATRLAAHVCLDQAPAAAEVLVAPATLLSGVTAAMWGPSSALVVLTGPGRGYIDDVEIDRLWKVFRVPSFERLCSLTGTVIASECEAHNGLHLLEVTPEWKPGLGVLHVAGEAIASVEDVREELCGCGIRVQKAFGAGAVIASRAA